MRDQTGSWSISASGKRRWTRERARVPAGRDRRGSVWCATGVSARSHLAVPNSMSSHLAAGWMWPLLPTGAPGTGQSTSLASAFVAGVMTALRSYRPELTVAQAEALLADTSAVGGGTVSPARRFCAVPCSGSVAARGRLSAASVPPRRRFRGAAVRPRDPRVFAAARSARDVVTADASTIRLARLPKGVRAAVRVGGRLRAQTRKRVIRVRAARKQMISYPIRRSRLGSL